MTVEAKFVEDSQNLVKVSVTVTDEGLGISDEDLPYLFKPFFKTRNQRSREQNGESHGIGLNFSKRLA